MKTISYAGMIRLVVGVLMLGVQFVFLTSAHSKEDCSVCPFTDYVHTTTDAEKNELFQCWAKALKAYHITFDQSTDNKVHDGFWLAHDLLLLPSTLLEFLRDTGPIEIQLSDTPGLDPCGAEITAAGCILKDLQGIIINYGGTTVNGLGEKPTGTAVHEVAHIFEERLQTSAGDNYWKKKYGYSLWGKIQTVFFQYKSGELFNIDQNLPIKMPASTGYVDIYAQTVDHDFVEHLMAYAKREIYVSSQVYSNFAQSTSDLPEKFLGASWFKKKALKERDYDGDSRLWNKYKFLRKNVFVGKEYTFIKDKYVLYSPPSYMVDLSGWIFYPGMQIDFTVDALVMGYPLNEIVTPVLEYKGVNGITLISEPQGAFQVKDMDVYKGMSFEYTFLPSEILKEGKVLEFKFYLKGSTGQVLGVPLLGKIAFNHYHHVKIWDDVYLRNTSASIKTFEQSVLAGCMKTGFPEPEDEKRVAYDGKGQGFWMVTPDPQKGLYYVDDAYSLQLTKSRIQWLKKPLHVKKTVKVEGRKENVQEAFVLENGHRLERLLLGESNRLWITTSALEILLFDTEGAFLEKYSDFVKTPLDPDIEVKPVCKYDALEKSMYVAVGRDVWKISEKGVKQYLFTANFLQPDPIDALEVLYYGFSPSGPPTVDAVVVGTRAGYVEVYLKQDAYSNPVMLFKVSGPVEAMTSLGSRLAVAAQDGEGSSLYIFDIGTGTIISSGKHVGRIKMITFREDDIPPPFQDENLKTKTLVFVEEMSPDVDLVVVYTMDGNFLHLSQGSRIFGLGFFVDYYQEVVP